MVPVVAPLPMLFTVRVYVPLIPTVKLPECDLTMVRSGAVTVVRSLAVLLAALLSPGVDTEAVFVTGEAVAAATVTATVSVITTEPLLPAIGFAASCVHVTTCGGPADVTEQVKFPPVPETKVMPVGSVSVTVMLPVVGLLPTLVTVRV